MRKQDPFGEVGSAYPINLTQLKDDEPDILLDRTTVSTFSSELESLMTGALVITASPDWRALRMLSMPRWEEFRSKLEQLPNCIPEAKQIQRRVFGHASPYDEGEPLVINGATPKYAHLSIQGILIALISDTAGLWDAQQLALWSD